jgi:hypothetical protein
MNTKQLRAIAVGVLSLGLGACQSPGQGSVAESNRRDLDDALDRMEVRLGEEQRSISNFTINGFKPIDESNLVVTSGTNDHYLINLTIPCLGLPYAFGMRFESRTSNITSFDNIIVNDLSGRPESCQISKIYRLEDIGAGGERTTNN